MLSMETDDQEAGYYQDQEAGTTYSSYKAQYRNYQNLVVGELGRS